MGFPYDDSIDRIDINGNIILKVNTGSTSDFISIAIKDPVSEKIGKMFDKPTRIAGIRIISSEYHLENSNNSPFMILIEPLVTDRSNTKFFIQFMFASSKSQDTINFLRSLYSKLKDIIMGLENE